MAESNILTGQYVSIQQASASVGDRIFAQLIDWVVLVAYLTFIIWVSVEFKLDSFWFIMLLVLFPLIFYTLFCEVFNHGQSLGKMVMKTRVVKVDGSTPSLGAFIMRWLLYLIDGPMTSFMGLVVIMLTKNHQRLGDLAAGTMVIKLQNYKKIQVSLDDYDYLMKNYTPRYPQAADLSLEQIEIIRRTVTTPRKDFLPRVMQLSQKVQQKLNIQRGEANDVAFLHRILRDYQYYALEEI
jgi:uncharacterized RDD family membrane protein YckC